MLEVKHNFVASHKNNDHMKNINSQPNQPKLQKIYDRYIRALNRE